uniref:Uncharacterized protein n=1 Tax=Neolamprologus brichardi TaxID=32507 RepID=A0A3Q4H8W7_NEOBR
MTFQRHSIYTQRGIRFLINPCFILNLILKLRLHCKPHCFIWIFCGTKMTSDGLKGHVFELVFPQQLPGMDLIRNKIWKTCFSCSFIELTTIQAQVNIKTTDGYFLLLFCLMTCDALTNDQKEVLNKVIHDSGSHFNVGLLLKSLKKSDLGKVMKFHVEGGGGSAAKAEGRDSGQL